MHVTMTVNGEQVSGEVEPRTLLVHFLRDQLRLTGTHWGCDTSNCGTCVVSVDGQPVKSCTMLAVMASGHDVRTVEGLAVDGKLDPVQEGFMQCHGLQCGFCTPGMMITARALLDENPHPSEDEIREAISGQICRCTGYTTIVRSIQWAAEHAEPGGPRVTTIEVRPEDTADNDQKPCGYGRMLRKEDPRFIRGRGNYVDDVQLPGMLHLAILRSPIAHARIITIDITAAQAHPKVKPSSPARSSPRRAWPGCRPCPTTCRPCSPPTRCASRARRSRSSSPRTATRPGTRWSSSTSTTSPWIR